MIQSSATFLQQCNEWQITVLDLPTAYWFHLITDLKLENLKLPASLRLIIIGGEEVKLDQVELWLSQGHHSVLINTYGPTEATVDATLYRIPTELKNLNTIPIGRPLANTKTYILDQHLQPVPMGVSGELYIGGDGLARGYLNRPELTEEKFILNPFAEGRLYRTGDLARYLPDGNIEYMGRIDNQVKIRGFRIELGEIETFLNTHPQIQETVVIAREDITGNKRIVAYIVGDNARLNTNEVREYLKQKLPEYMLPSAFILLKNFPLTPNGKIDRKALPAPELDLSTEGQLILPRDTIELKLAQIWSDLLGINPIGVTNNFFELGGHSLLAVRLMSHIQQQFHKKLSLATLFQNSTIEQIAHLLRLETNSLDWSVLVPIKSQGNKPPLFCIHPSGGNVLCYQDLAYQLDLDRPVYGLQSFGLNPEKQPHTSIEQMASYYIQAIQTVQSHRPYFILGWSLGGIVAFEMAQQLSRQGEEIAFLASVDSDPLFTTSELENDDAVLMVWLLAEELEPCLSEIKQLAPQEKLLYLLDKAKQKNLVPEDFDLTEVQHLLEINKLNILALGKYQPQLYSGAMIVIQASETDTDLALVWNEFVEKVDAHVIPGNHYNIVRPPQVQILAQILQKYLDLAH